MKRHVEIVVRGPFGTVESKIDGRTFLQRLGVEGIRDTLGERVLLEAVPLERNCDLLIVTDVRFDNEAEYIREAGGRVWEVVRPAPSVDKHASEQPIARELVDRVIENTGTIDDLRNLIRESMGE